MANKAPWYGRIPVGAAASAIEGLGLPGDISEILLSLANQGIQGATGYKNFLPPQLAPTSRDIRQYVTEPLAEATVGKEYLEPGSFPEEILQKTARTLPLIAATGGLATPALAGANIARDIAGSTALTAAEKAGAPIPVQLLAGMLGEGGFNKLANWASKTKIAPQNLASMAEQAKKQFYDQTAQLGSKVNFKAPGYRNTLEKLKKKINTDTRLTIGDRAQLVNDIDMYLGDVKKGSLKGSQAVTRRAELNDIISNATDANVRNYYSAIRKPLVETIESERKAFPNFSKSLQNADDIHAAINFPQNFLKSVQEFPYLGKALKNPLAYGAAAIGPSLYFTRDPMSTLALAGITGGGAAAIGKGTQVLGFMRGEQPRKLLAKASTELIKGKAPQAARTYAKVNRLADRYEKNEQRLQRQREAHIKKATAHLVPV